MVLTIIAGASVFPSTFFGLGGKKFVIDLISCMELSKYGLLKWWF